MKLQVCDHCGRSVAGQKSGVVMTHPDVDEDHGTNGGHFQPFDLCPRCYRAFMKMFLEWLAAGLVKPVTFSVKRGARM